MTFWRARLGEDDLSAAGEIILARLNLAPVYRHDNGVNKVSLPLSAKEPNRFMPLGVAAVLAVVLGLGSSLLPTETQTFLSDEGRSPLFHALAGVATPMIFLSITWLLLCVC